MALNQFPVLPGLAWSVVKEPAFRTRVQKSVSGRERRANDQALPIWTFTLTYDFLRNDPAAGYAELDTLMGFHAQQQGAFAAFLYTDPTDNMAAGQYLGTGNASQTQFQLVRLLGVALPGPGFAEPIVAPNAVSAVYLNGVIQPASAYSVNSGTGVVTFATAPGSGVAVTADFTFFFRVRFSDDTASFENFMFRLWRLKQLKFVSVLL
ncbi:MAG TPA: DUF2460 domain-containing protein [Stellaceae bacterium]|nr:DUF2460 domain-containing protein [Stellaceae bacterium]